MILNLKENYGFFVHKWLQTDLFPLRVKLVLSNYDEFKYINRNTTWKGWHHDYCWKSFPYFWVVIIVPVVEEYKCFSASLKFLKRLANKKRIFFNFYKWFHQLNILFLRDLKTMRLICKTMKSYLYGDTIGKVMAVGVP